jgi:FKBP-type peptidyl-prolyl cis-trans isomerase (trigger factor)
MYLLQPIAKEQNFSATQEDLMHEITYESTQVPPEHRIVFNNMSPQEAQNRLFMRIMMRKALDWIAAQISK